jgi:hypothetical protein
VSKFFRDTKSQLAETLYFSQQIVAEIRIAEQSKTYFKPANFNF